MGGKNIFKKTLTTAREGHTSRSPLSNGIKGFSEFQHPPFREEDGKDTKFEQFFWYIWISFLYLFLKKCLPLKPFAMFSPNFKKNIKNAGSIFDRFLKKFWSQIDPKSFPKRCRKGYEKGWRFLTS